jgi:hypothetical protein
MTTQCKCGNAGPAEYMAKHRLLAAAWVAAATSAAGVFVARAVKSRTAKGRAGWAALATLEFAIAIGIIRTQVNAKQRESLSRM